MEWLKKHADTITILSIFFGCFWHLNGKIEDLTKEFGNIKTEIAVMKAVMIMQKIMPVELANKE